MSYPLPNSLLSNNQDSASASGSLPLPNANPYSFGQFPGVGRWSGSLSAPVTESCWFRGSLSGLMGGGLGFAFGLFTASMGSGVNNYAIQPGMPGWIDTTNMPLKEQIRRTGKEMWGSMKSSGKSFGSFGFVYTIIECAVEKNRGSHDVMNPLLAGCATGGLFGSRGGPQAAIVGCAGFAAFGYVIDKFTEMM